MAELPPVDPPQRGESEGSSVVSDLIKVTATIGALAAAAGGSKIILKNLPPSVLQKAKDKLTKYGLKQMQALEKHPTLLHGVDKAFLANPGSGTGVVLEQQLREVSMRELGLIHAIETINKMQASDLHMQKAIHEDILLKYDLGIPALQDGAWRRATLGDFMESVRAGKIDMPSEKLKTNLDIDGAAYALGMDSKKLYGMRLESNLMYHADKGIVNLNRMNVFRRTIEAVEDMTFMGIPIFKIRADKRGDHLGMGLFGKTTYKDGETPHPLVKHLTGKDQGQLLALNDNIYFKAGENTDWALQKNLSGKYTITTDYKASEFGIRGTDPTGVSYDEIFFGVTGEKKGFFDRAGIGGKYMPPNQSSILESMGHLDLDDHGRKRGLAGRIKHFFAENDITGLVGGAKRKYPEGIGSHAGVATSGDKAGSIYLKRTGLAGMSDWANAQASRPLYLLNQIGVGMRPGSNALTTMGRVSALMAGVYMAKEAVSYGDYLLGNVPSTALGKAVGYSHLARQEMLEATGATDAINSVEDETPGLTSSPLSNILRFGAAAVGGIYAGHKLGGGKFMMGLVTDVARKGIGKIGMGKAVVRNMVSNTSVSNVAGVITGGLLGAGFGASTMGDLGRDPDEIRQEIEGSRQVAYKASAGWMLGRDPFAGGRIRFHKPSMYNAAGTDYEGIGVYGSETNRWAKGSWLPTPTNLGGLRRLFDPYYAEDRNAATRPYPATSGHFGDYPIFGPAIEATAGNLLKPTRYRNNSGNLDTTNAMNSAVQQQAAGKMAGHFTGNATGYSGLSPVQIEKMGLGEAGLVPGNVGTASNVSNAFANLNRNIQEYSGLRGFQMQFISQFLTGSGNPGLDKPVLASSGKMTSTARSYFDTEQGGLFGATELLRRFIVRDSGQPTVNTIANSLPRWLPGSGSMFEGDRNFYADFSTGDAYTKTPAGEARLPGPGRDSLYQKHGGSSYSIVDSFLVLADVAPFTEAYRVTKQEVERLIRRDKLSPEWINKYRIAVEQSETKSQHRVFHSDRYLKHKRVTVTDVLGPTTFKTAEYGDKVFNLEGTYLNRKDPIELMSKRQASGMSAGAAKASIAGDRDRLQSMLQNLKGRSIDVDITGESMGRTSARIGELDSALEDMGVVKEDRLYEQGAVGQVYTGAGKLMGELGATLGALAGLKAGGKQIGGITGSAGSPLSKIAAVALPAIVGGVTGGWVENKFTGDYSASEHYKRFQVYGSTFADWTRPYMSFIRPWTHSAASTIGDYTPGFRKEQYQMEEYMDMLKYTKYSQLAATEGAPREMAQMAGQTLVGLDYSELKASSPDLFEALPANERQYFRQFAAEQDPTARTEIIEAVPEYMKSVYLAIWNNQSDLGSSGLEKAYSEHVRPKLNKSASERASEFFMDKGVPNSNWMGWHPSVNLSDVKYRAIQMAGGNPHDHGLFSSQGRNIDAYNPEINDIAEEVADTMGAHIDIGPIRKGWNRIMNDGILNVSPNFSGKTTAEVSIFQDDTHRYDAYYTQRAAGNVGLY